MGFGSTLEDLVEEKLLRMHTAFFAKIIRMNGDGTCDIQPLDKIKAYGKTAKQQAPVTSVPILSHVRHYKLVSQSLTVTDTYSGGGSISPNPHEGHLQVSLPRAGDLVFCVCAERDITSSIKGTSSVPPVGHHQISNAVVVGLLGG